MKPILGIDTETTGLGKEDKVCQIALLLVNPATWEVERKFSSLVNPERPIHPQASAIHGLSDADAADAPTLPELLENSWLYKWFSEADVVFGHNVGFDIRMVGVSHFIDKKVIDTLPVVKTLYPLWPNHKLTTCARMLELPLFDAHDALGDIEATAALLKEMNLRHGHSLDDFVQLSRGIKTHYHDLLKTKGLWK